MLPFPANVTVDLYRGSNAGGPYAFGPLAQKAIPAYLVGADQSGRFGTALWLKWTHVLYVDLIDIRDAYNTQLDPARNDSLGDTVVLTDSVNANKTAYWVNFVERIAIGTPQTHLRAYLDHFIPNAWPTDSL